MFFSFAFSFAFRPLLKHKAIVFVLQVSMQLMIIGKTLDIGGPGVDTL